MTDPDTLDRGTTIGGYLIERILGRGRMGTIYLAQSPDLPRHDTLKVLNADLVHDPAFRHRFLREADVGAQLSHPNIVSVYRRGSTDDNGLWIAMQYVDGIDADTALRQGVLTPARAVHIVSEIAKALDYAHDRGVVHRDVKPANFLLSGTPDRFERVFLSDFGIAQTRSDDPAESESPVVATIAYAAPEILTRQAVDGRADIYALGCSLYRMLTAAVPFPHKGDTAAAIRSHLEAPPPRVTDIRPDLPAAFDAVIAKAMAKNPADRYESAKELATAASAALDTPKAPPQQPVIPPRHPISPPPRLTHTTPPPTPPAAPRRHTGDAPSDRPTGGAPDSGRPPMPFVEPATLVTASLLPRKDRGRRLKIVGAVLGTAALVAVIALVVAGQDSDNSTPTSAVQSESATSTRSPADETKLLSLLPAGYPPNACHPVDPTDGASAKVTCTAAVDPASNATVTYFLMPEKVKLANTFQEIVQKSSAVTCPGRIQSPGPWRRNATPQLIAGTVFCGQNTTTATVGWTTDDQSLITVVQAPTGGPDLTQLYGWWSAHS